jgi:arylsulfatase A-like enzyme
MSTTTPNLLLITVDTLRADHLGCYAYHRDTSPHIDAIAAQGARCEHMFCAGIPTHPSYTTLYTGQHPITHGVVGHGGQAKLDSATPVLPELFLRAGYTTSAFDTLMRDRLWFGRGYEYYIDPSLRRVLRLAVSCEEINRRAVPWLRHHADEPFFMFLHYWDPHAPYTPAERLRGRFYEGARPTDPADSSLAKWWEHPLGALARSTWARRHDGPITDADYVVAMYDQCIGHVDEAIGGLVGTLDELGLADDTLVVIMGDHGESMTEHGIFFEHHGLYDCTVRVPFIARWPGQIRAGTLLPKLQQTNDIAPTLLAAVGLPTPRSMDGESFWPALAGEQAQVGREQVVGLEGTLQAKWYLRTERHKLILARQADFYDNPPRELYDLAADPEERNNLVDEQHELAAALEARLEGWIANQLAARGRAADPLREQGISLRAVMEAG